MTTTSETGPASTPRLAGPEGDAPSLGKLLRLPVLFGAAVVTVFFGVFGLWAGLAPLASGAVASGVVEADTGAQVVQHLEGGIIRALNVSQGDQVNEGDVLLMLEPTRAAAQFSADRQRWLRFLVVRARLEAQSRNAEGMDLPAEVRNADSPALSQFVEAQRRAFETRLSRYESEMEILRRQIEQVHNQTAAIESQNEGLTRQLDLVEQQVSDLSRLVEQGLESRSRLLQRQEQQAQLEAEIAANRARLAEARNSIAEREQEVLRAQYTYQNEVAGELTQVNNDIAQVDESLVSTRDVLDRTRITSPVGGTVTNLEFHTTGGVIGPGDPIMEVVPNDADRIIVARVSPQDIDVVRTGLVANVHLLPFQNRNRLPLKGEVIQVAPDSVQDENSGELYYEVRIEVSAEEIARQQGIYLGPGMPAEVIIVAGEQTMLQYLFNPVLQSLRRAFVYTN